MNKKIIVLLSCISLIGCSSNPYKKYSDVDQEAYSLEAKNVLSYLQENEEPRLVEVSNMNVKEFIEEGESLGFIPVAISGFEGKYENNKKQCLEFAKELKAKLVILSISYNKTETKTGSISLPKIVQSNTTGTIGNNLMSTSNINLNTTTTTYENKTYTYDVDKYSYKALYFTTLKDNLNPRIGINMRELSFEEKKLHKINQGFIIDTVYKNSPAYYGNLFKNDIILEVNNQKFYTYEEYHEIVKNKNTVKYKIKRNEKIFDIKLEKKAFKYENKI